MSAAHKELVGTRTRRLMKAVLVIASALTLPACPATTKKVTEQQKKSAPFQVGKTTYQEVIATLGEPAGSTRHPDGSRAINYFHSRFKEGAKSDIPYIGGFLDGSEVESSSVSMQFDKNGILSHYSAMFGRTSHGLTATAAP